MRYVVMSTVHSVEERFDATYSVDPKNEKGELIKERGASFGWFVRFEGSHESIHMGMEKPEFGKGDHVKITFEKIS